MIYILKLKMRFPLTITYVCSFGKALPTYVCGF